MSTTSMSISHKEALAVGREEGRAVRAYLDALEHCRPKRGRKFSTERAAARITEIDAALAAGSAAPLERLEMIQERMDLEARLAAGNGQDVLQDAQKRFVDVAASYSERKGISYQAWREVGVPADVLKEAGVKR